MKTTSSLPHLVNRNHLPPRPPKKFLHTLESSEPMLSTRAPYTESTKGQSPPPGRPLSSLEAITGGGPFNDYLMNVNFSGAMDSRNTRSSMEERYLSSVPAIKVAPVRSHLQVPPPGASKHSSVRESMDSSAKTLSGFMRGTPNDAHTPRRSAMRRKDGNKGVISALGGQEVEHSDTSDDGAEAGSRRAPRKSKKSLVLLERERRAVSRSAMVMQIFKQLSAVDRFVRLKTKDRVWQRVAGVINQIPVMRKHLSKSVGKVFPRVTEL